MLLDEIKSVLSFAAFKSDPDDSAVPWGKRFETRKSLLINVSRGSVSWRSVNKRGRFEEGGVQEGELADAAPQPVDDPVLVLMAGLGGQLLNYPDEFCLAFVDRGMRVVRFDNRDVGLSTKIDAAGLPDVPAALNRARQLGLNWHKDDTTYYLAHLSLFTHSESRLGMSEWRDKLFVFISRNARSATSFFQIPPDRVIEIGIQLEL